MDGNNTFSSEESSLPPTTSVKRKGFGICLENWERLEALSQPVCGYEGEILSRL